MSHSLLVSAHSLELGQFSQGLWRMKNLQYDGADSSLHCLDQKQESHVRISFFVVSVVSISYNGFNDET